MPRYPNCFEGNPRLKAAYVRLEWTPEQLAEYLRCMEDPFYFIRNYVSIVTLDHGIQKFGLWDFQEDLVQTYLDERFVIAKFPRQVGKALKLDTPIFSPTGWKKMGELAVGDTIYGRNGEETKITFVSETFYDRDTYKITFDNGESVVCSDHHLWNVACADWKHKEKTLETTELIEYFQKKKHNSQGLYTRVADAIPFEHKELPIDPYVLGLWLGDGNSRGDTITTSSWDLPHLIDKIESCDFEVTTIRKDKRNENTYRFRIDGLTRQLRHNNLLQNKHIPDAYLTSSIEQRYELIRGLMDSDGSCRKNGGCEFYNKDLLLVKSFRHILSTLGIKSRLLNKTINGTLYYTVRFCSEHPVFTLPRKCNRQRHIHPKNKRHYIQSIEKIECTPSVCIQVDSEDHMFLCGETLIPTHNTVTTVAYLLWKLIFNETFSVAILANKLKTAKEIMDKFKAAYERLPFWLQQGVKEWNQHGILLENDSKITVSATTLDAIRGFSHNVVLLDEFAMVKSNIAEDFMASVFPTISASKTAQILVLSTPKGMNHFYKLWCDAEDGKNGFVAKSVHWRDVPGRDEEWERTQRDKLQDKFAQEHECVAEDTFVTVRKNGVIYRISIAELYDSL